MPTIEASPSDGVSLPETLPSKEYLENLNGLVDTAKKNVNGIYVSLMTQVLENADQIRESVTANGKDGIKSLVENMLKAPIRKHSGRLKAVEKGLEEVQNQLRMLASNLQERSDAKTTSPTGIQC